MLSAQESSQARQMDRGEIEVKEEKRVRMKRVPVLPRDKEKDENENMRVAIRSQCKTEDSPKRFENESSVPREATGRGSLARGTDADLATNPVLIQEPHSAVGSRRPRPSCGQLCTGKPRYVWLGRSVAQKRCWVCNPDTRRPSLG